MLARIGFLTYPLNPFELGDGGLQRRSSTTSGAQHSRNLTLSGIPSLFMGMLWSKAANFSLFPFPLPTFFRPLSAINGRMFTVNAPLLLFRLPADFCDFFCP